MIPTNDIYLMGILNSTVGWFLISNYCTQIQNGYQLIFKYLGKIPIRTIDFSNPTDKTIHNKMVNLVDRMHNLHKRLNEVKSPTEIERLQRQIDATDQQIDKLVYRLYGLTKDEIDIIEKSV